MLHVISHGPASEDPLPHAGKGEIAQILARAGLQLGVTTVGRILKEKPPHQPTAAQAAEAPQRVVTSKYPNDAWLADLTTLPIGSGFWASWLPSPCRNAGLSAGGLAW